ncbi:MAG: DUF507 family protein [Deltaproteobacteria bacterium]|nr:DUF507 family protein [Deltaproteobacteria bacterium]
MAPSYQRGWTLEGGAVNCYVPMRLYRGLVTPIATEITQSLLRSRDIESSLPNEVQLDIEAVLKEYLRQEKLVLDEAKDRLERRKMPATELGRMKSVVARERNVPIGDEILPYLVEQILEMLFHSQHVEEIYADDKVLRTKITAVLRKHLDIEESLDREVRKRLKHLEEGTLAFEQEYARLMAEIKRVRRLNES